MLHLSFKNIDLTITWRMWLILAVTAAGIYLGGVTSAYFLAQVQFSQRAAASDKTVAEIPEKTADKTAQKVIQAIKDDKQ